MPEPDELLDDLIDDAQYDAALRHTAGLIRTSELRLRLVGPQVRDGFYDPAVEEALSGPLGRELLAASGDSKSPETRLGLVGISAGSVVLHYRPAVPALGDDGGQAGVEITPADAAVRRVLRLHDLFERGASPSEVAAFAGTNTRLLKGAEGVVEALANST